MLYCVVRLMVRVRNRVRREYLPSGLSWLSASVHFEHLTQRHYDHAVEVVVVVVVVAAAAAAAAATAAAARAVICNFTD